MTLDDFKNIGRGDVVKINSGGPEMTVFETEASYVTCDYWHPDEKKFKNVTYDYAQLTIVRKENS